MQMHDIPVVLIIYSKTNFLYKRNSSFFFGSEYLTWKKINRGNPTSKSNLKLRYKYKMVNPNSSDCK